MVDIAVRPLGLWQMRYLVLTREDLTNQVKGHALRNKTTSVVCRFLLEDVICKYGCVRKIVANRGKLNVNESKEFFSRIRVKLSLTKAYNPKANGKVQRGHWPIVKALVKSCVGKLCEWPKLLPYVLWVDRTTHNIITRFIPTELTIGTKPACQ